MKSGNDIPRTEPQRPQAARYIAGPATASALSSVQKKSRRQSKAAPCEPVTPKLHARNLTPDPAGWRTNAVDCVTQTSRGSDGLNFKDAGGNPPALGRPSIRRVRFVHARMHTSLLKHFPTDLPEVILLESAPAAKEFKIGLGLLASIKLNSRKLDAAYVIGGLRQQIVPWRCVFENSCFASDRALDGRVHCLSDDALTPVVIDLYLIESLQVSEMGSEVLHDIALDMLCKPAWRGCNPSLLIAEARIGNGQLVEHHRKRNEQLQAAGDVFPFVAIVAVQKRTEMKGNLILTEFPEHSVVPGYGLIELKALIMKDQNDYVVLGDTAGISRLVDKNGKIPHRRSPLKAKTPGGNPPALGGPSIRGIHPFYTTKRNVDSILPKVEHMFYIIDTNICSPYRKAA